MYVSDEKLAACCRVTALLGVLSLAGAFAFVSIFPKPATPRDAAVAGAAVDAASAR